ncbi:hypothetical protein [Mucilaginibacter sp.]
MLNQRGFWFFVRKICGFVLLAEGEKLHPGNASFTSINLDCGKFFR